MPQTANHGLQQTYNRTQHYLKQCIAYIFFKNLTLNIWFFLKIRKNGMCINMHLLNLIEYLKHICRFPIPQLLPKPTTFLHVHSYSLYVTLYRCKHALQRSSFTST